MQGALLCEMASHLACILEIGCGMCQAERPAKILVQRSHFCDHAEWLIDLSGSMMVGRRADSKEERCGYNSTDLIFCFMTMTAKLLVVYMLLE